KKIVVLNIFLPLLGFFLYMLLRRGKIKKREKKISIVLKEKREYYRYRKEESKNPTMTALRVAKQVRKLLVQNGECKESSAMQRMKWSMIEKNKFFVQQTQKISDAIAYAETNKEETYIS